MGIIYVACRVWYELAAFSIPHLWFRLPYQAWVPAVGVIAVCQRRAGRLPVGKVELAQAFYYTSV